MRLLTLILSVFLLSCSSSKTLNIKEASSSEYSEVFQPSWFQQESSEDEEYFYVYGLGSSRDRNVAYDEAKSNATQEMAQQLEQKVETMMNNMRRRHGSQENEQILTSTNSIFRTVSSNVIEGLQVDKSKTYKNGKKNIYETFIRLKLSKKQATKKYSQALKNDEALYTEFKEKQMLKDLDEQIEKFKKNN